MSLARCSRQSSGPRMEALEGRLFMSAAPLAHPNARHRPAPIPLFQPPRAIAVGPSPEAVAIGDFNGDGKLDAVVTEYGAGGDTGIHGMADVLLGDGHGGFAPAVRYDAGDHLSGLTIGDFNGDGKLDLAVCGDDAAVLLGRGDGTFDAARHFATGNTPQNLVAGDFNGDGRLDLAVTNIFGDSVSILPGNGDGTFAAGREFAAGAGPCGIAAADFNGDRKLDLAVTDVGEGVTGPGAGVRIFTGAGDGTFSLAATLKAGSRPIAVQVADLNRDRRPDLVVANGGFGVANPDGNASVSVLLGGRRARFALAKNYATGRDPQGITIGDVNGDGKPDVLTANFQGASISVLLGNGDGTLRPAQTIAGLEGTGSLALGDFNGDHKLDILTQDAYGTSVKLLLAS